MFLAHVHACDGKLKCELVLFTKFSTGPLFSVSY